MTLDTLKGNLLKQSVAEYGCGKYATKKLREKTEKDRRLFGENLTLFFNGNGWMFNEQSARAWIESKTNHDEKGTVTNKSSFNRYVAQIRAFNKFCIDRKYLTLNFCQWISKYPEYETLKPIPDISHEVLLKAISLGTLKGKYDKLRSLRIKIEGEAALLFMLFTSRRSGEFVKLEGTDIKLAATEPKYFAHLKGGKYLDFPIPENLLEMMRKRQHKKKVFEVTPSTTIQYLRNGLRAQGVPEATIKLVDNHTLRKAFAKERYKNKESVDKIADTMDDTVEVVRKHYLGRDLEGMRNTVNNTKIAKESIEVSSIVKDIKSYIETITRNDSRFNPLAAEEALNIEKLLKVP